MKVEILEDINFEHEFGCKGLSSALTAHQVFDTLSWPNAKKGYIWTIAEWASKYLTKDVKEVELPDTITSISSTAFTPSSSRYGNFSMIF